MWLHPSGLDHECKGDALGGQYTWTSDSRSALSNESTFQCNLASYVYTRLLSNSVPTVCVALRRPPSGMTNLGAYCSPDDALRRG